MQLVRQRSADDTHSFAHLPKWGNHTAWAIWRATEVRSVARHSPWADWPTHDFRFVCAMRTTERQIGNAVPPVLAWHIAKAVRDHIDP